MWYLRAILVVGLIGLGPAVGAEPLEADRPAVLVLKNGQVLEGQITPLGDRYQVALVNGGELRVTQTQVDFVANSLDDAYRRKKSLIAPNNLNERLDLAEWCLRHKQLSSAAEELA